MNTTGKVILGVVTAGAILLMAKPAAAAGEYRCIYGDGLVFDTLAELQEHVRTAHPGMRVPIDIKWD